MIDAVKERTDLPTSFQLIEEAHPAYPLREPVWLFAGQGTELTAYRRECLALIAFGGSNWAVVHHRVQYPGGACRNTLRVELIEEGNALAVLQTDNPVAIFVREGNELHCDQVPYTRRLGNLPWESLAEVLTPHAVCAWFAEYSLPPEMQQSAVICPN